MMKRRLFLSICLAVLAVAVAVGANDKPRKAQVYMFGFAASMTDSVCVMTESSMTYSPPVIWMPLAPKSRTDSSIPLAAAVSALGIGGMLNYIAEGRQKHFLKAAFRRYLSPTVVDQLIRHPERLRLGGERRELTIFFSDLQGFSSFSERLSPEDLTHLLNDYLTDMTDIILEEGGTLDKYEGDAIIAFWGAPIEQPDHAVRAVRAAVRCQRRLAERRDEWAQRYGAVLKMRVGINTGPVVVGNMGSNQRFDYTILGDAANLASRLEGANKALGTYLMISESAWTATGGAFPGRELGALRVVGRHTPVRVWEATGLPGDPPPPDAAPYEASPTMSPWVFDSSIMSLICPANTMWSPPMMNSSASMGTFTLSKWCMRMSCPPFTSSSPA